MFDRSKPSLFFFSEFQKTLNKKTKQENFEPQYCITKPQLIEDSITKLYNFLNPKMPSGAIIYREYELFRDDKRKEIDYIKKTINKISNNNKIKLIIAKDYKVLNMYKIDGLHFSDLDKLPFSILRKNRLPKNFIITYSVHDLKKFTKIKKILNPDVIFISPIFSTEKYYGTNLEKGIGKIKFAKFALKTKQIGYDIKNVCALGGVNRNNIKFVKLLGNKTGDRTIRGFGSVKLFCS